MSDDPDHGTEPCPECTGEGIVLLLDYDGEYQSRCGMCGGDGRVPDADHVEYFAPRYLFEAAIDALTEQAAEAELWRGIRDYRIDDPLASAAALRAIIGPTPEPTAKEQAESLARMNAYLAERYPHLAWQAEEGE